jgi:catechol 2,3-dioxygenase-like lactoylglutathione lyase family enzyme
MEGEERTLGISPAITPIHIKKLGHIVLTVKDVERSLRFWREIMGFKISDVNERGMVFLRCGPDHHTVALAQATEGGNLPKQGEVGFNHAAFEVASVTELFAIREFLRAKEVPILYEGRRGPGSNPGIEILDPDGYQFEIYAAMDQIGWDGKSRPVDQLRRATSLEEAIETPLPGTDYGV